MKQAVFDKDAHLLKMQFWAKRAQFYRLIFIFLLLEGKEGDLLKPTVSSVKVNEENKLS